MTTTYCTSADVAKLIWRAGDGSDFTASTNPTQSFVEDLINAAEDEIDARTRHAWRSTLVSDELHDYIRNNAYRQRGWWSYRGKIFLNHRAIHDFTAGTHKIEIWDGSDWIDLVSDDYTEGRNDDYWIDYNQGIIYFVNTYPFEIEQGVRVTYAYGEDTVPNDIRFACAKMAAIDLVMQDDRSVMVVEGSDNVPQPSKVEIWQAAIEKTLEKYAEIINV